MSYYFKKLNLNQVNVFCIASFYLIFLNYIVTKGFISNEELSDKYFLTINFILFEICIFYILRKSLIINFKNNYNYIFFVLFFSLIFIIWNNETLSSNFQVLLFIAFNFSLIIPFLLIEYKVKELSDIDISTFLSFFIISLFISGLYFTVNYENLDHFFNIYIICFFYIILFKVFKKFNLFFQIIISALIILVISKVFLFSALKDPFHYSWFLGPINSLNTSNELLKDVVSQYGYLNLLLVQKLSVLLSINSNLIFILTIIIFFFIFFFLFLHEIKKIIHYPVPFLVLFLSLLIFANLGHYGFSGAMYVPSSSVYRFLPSIITIYFFNKSLNDKSVIKFNFIIFLLSFLISILWSFESLFFVTFTLISFLIFHIFFIFLENDSLLIKFKNLFFNRKIFISFFSLSFLLILILHNKNLLFFYESALNLSASGLPKEINNNKITLLFIFVLLLSYLILRDSLSLDNKKDFLSNTLWFSLLISFTSYFLIRSVDSNIFNLLPFFIFFIVLLKTSSNYLNIFKLYSLKLIITFTIISSFYSIYFYKDIFYKNLLAKEFIKLPIYLSKNYLPNKSILKIIKEYDNIPLTLITGKTTHELNNNLPSFGFGLPIIPLEGFNILNTKRKEYLMNSYFNKNDQHFLLCKIDCKFYNKNKKNKSSQDIYLSEGVFYEVLFENNAIDNTEVLFLLTKS